MLEGSHGYESEAQNSTKKRMYIKKKLKLRGLKKYGLSER